MKTILCLLVWSLLLWPLPAAIAAEPDAPPPPKPVYIGIDAEFGYRDSTSAEAIRYGVQIAMAEINRQGGVLGGRPLKLVVRANNSVPARSLVNIEELAAIPDLVAVFCGRFSPPIVASLPLVHQRRLILLDPWAAGDDLVDNGHKPNYVFRLSLRDSDALAVMIDRARRLGASRIGLLLLNTSWGRSSQKAAENYLRSMKDSAPLLVGQAWFNWQDQSLLERYQSLRHSGAEAILMVTNAETAAILVNEVAQLPPEERLPLIFHWGITGGSFPEMVGTNLEKVDHSVVQTYSFVGKTDAIAGKVLAAAREMFGIPGPRQVPSPVGMAHAYDLTRILARAIDLAGTTDREKVHDALEQVRDYPGLVRFFRRPFTPERHEALARGDLFMARYDPQDHALVPIAP